jgi:hypothetical protein
MLQKKRNGKAETFIQTSLAMEIECSANQASPIACETKCETDNRVNLVARGHSSMNKCRRCTGQASASGRPDDVAPELWAGLPSFEI